MRKIIEGKFIKNKEVESKILKEFERNGLKCEKMDNFFWSESLKKIQMKLGFDLGAFIKTSEEKHVNKKRKSIENYLIYNKDKKQKTGSKESFSHTGSGIKLYMNYKEGEMTIPRIYITDSYFSTQHVNYSMEWLEILEKNGYKEEVEEIKFISLFSKEEARNFLVQSLKTLNEQMSQEKQWLEREVGVRIIKIIDQLIKEG